MKSSICYTLMTLICFVYCIGANAQACKSESTWSKDIESLQPSTIAQVIEKAKSMGMQLEKEDDFSKCASSVSFSLIEVSTNKYIVSIPVPFVAINADDGRYLDVRLKQVLVTPKEKLLVLAAAEKEFYEDSQALDEELGVSFYSDGSVKDGNEMTAYIYANDVCSFELYRNKAVLVENVIEADFKIPAIKYIPGKSSYDANSIYKKGDFRKIIFSDRVLLGKLLVISQTNAKSCNSKYQDIKKWADRAVLFHAALEKLN